MIKRYPQLQSGFIGKNEEAFTKPREPEPNVIRPLLNRPPNNTQDEYFYSHEFDHAYEQYLIDSSIYNCPRKHSEILQLLQKLFAGQGWSHFVRLQENNPNLSDLHVQFLAETTLLLSQTQQRRKASLPTWASLLSNANQALTTPFRSSMNRVSGDVTFSQFFSANPALADLDKTLLNWIRAYGLSDLMMTAKVLFGRRSIHATRGRSM